MTAKRFQWVFIKDNELELRDNGIVKRFNNERLEELLNKLSEENEHLKLQLQNTSDQRDEFHRGARENANRVGKLKKENEQLKQAYTQLKHRHSLLHDVCVDAECDRDSYRKDIASLEKENEQLKQFIQDLTTKGTGRIDLANGYSYSVSAILSDFKK